MKDRSNVKGYQFRVRWFPEESKWMGQCPPHMDLHSLSDDPNEALESIMDLVEDKLKVSASQASDVSVFDAMDNALSNPPGPFGKIR